MPVHRGNVVRVINEAWARASAGARDEENEQIQNKNRSTRWMCELANGFATEYGDEVRHRIFWAGSEANQEHFRRNEFLFDLMVCRVSETESLERHSRPLEFIDECYWQVESEFNVDDSRELIVDMSKLVAGSAQNKLFIASHRNTNREKVKRMCGEMASRCSGNVYFAFVSHPAEWVVAPRDPVVFAWECGRWVEIGQRS